MIILACPISAQKKKIKPQPQEDVEKEVKTLAADLTDFLIPPASYQQTAETLEAAFPKGKHKKNPYFSWLTKDKSRAIFKRHLSPSFKVDLTILDKNVPIDEMIIDFQDGKFLGCTISVFNRGDSKKLSGSEFLRRKEAINKAISEILKINPRKREGNTKRGILTSGLTWRSPRGFAVLAHNVEAPGKVEFMRLRLGHYKAQGLYRDALKDQTISSVKKRDIKENVVTDGDKVYIKNIPMVDQGSKGYCVVASVQRVLEYYGISCDMHQLAQIARTDPTRGTSTLVAAQQIGRIDHFFKTRYDTIAAKRSHYTTQTFFKVKGEYLDGEIEKDAVIRRITSMIDKGIPVLWSLEVGRYKEHPPLAKQASGGHMRLIIGYDLENNTIYFSDSWGAGHELKHMKLDDAMRATNGFYTLTPTIN